MLPPPHPEGRASNRYRYRTLREKTMKNGKTKRKKKEYGKKKEDD
jgi:hypothetical protein